MFWILFSTRNDLPPCELLFWDWFAKASTDAVFKYFSTDSGVPAERLWNAMRILGINPKQDEDFWQQLQLCPFALRLLLPCFLFLLMPCFCRTQADKHLVDLGRPKYIDHKMFHRFIED